MINFFDQLDPSINRVVTSTGPFDQLDSSINRVVTSTGPFDQLDSSINWVLTPNINWILQSTGS